VLKPIENLLAGWPLFAYIHHVFTWLFILFIVAHIYMAFWYDAVLKEGRFHQMIGGRVVQKDKRLTGKTMVFFGEGRDIIILPSCYLWDFQYVYD